MSLPLSNLAAKGAAETISFGVLLKQLRKRAGMTQRDLAAALHYSDALISNFELGQRLPDPETVATRFVPVLGLQDDPALAARLIEAAAVARGERVPVVALALGSNGRSHKREDEGQVA